MQFSIHALLIESVVAALLGAVGAAGIGPKSDTSLPPIPVITLPPAPPNFSDIPPESLSCYNLWASAGGTNAFISKEASDRKTSRFINTTSNWESTTTFELCSEVPVTGPYTTLCDGVARYTSLNISTSCTLYVDTRKSSLGPHTETATPPWVSSWSISNEVPTPSCTMAPDYQSLCYRLHSLYSWRTNQAQTAIGNGTTTPEYILRSQMPSCKTWYNTPPPDLATRKCFLGVDNYAVYYWPSAPQPGTSFCANMTRSPGGTPTIPGLPNTAVVSGFTLTSPSVYHFLTGVAVSTSMGESKRGRIFDPVYNFSTYVPEPVLTIPQNENDIWTAQPSYTGHGWHAHWKYHFGIGDYNADAMTMAKLPAFFDACRRAKIGYPGFSCSNSTVVQAHFRQHAALSVTHVLNAWKGAQFQDCIWQKYNDYDPSNEIHEMWIAPGEPWRATPIVTANPVGVAPTTAQPGSTLESVPMKTATKRGALSKL